MHFMVISLFLQESFLLPELGSIFVKNVKLEVMLRIIRINKACQGKLQWLRITSKVVCMFTSTNI